MDAPRQRSGETSGSRPAASHDPQQAVLYLCTTFPRLSETFVEREIRHLARTFPLKIVSMWGGGPAEDLSVQPIPIRSLGKLLGIIPLWLFRNPSGLCRLLRVFFRRFPRSFLNLQETLLGMGVGILLADGVRRNPPRWIHAIWATAPATTALTLHYLTGARFSFGAHAYDLFQDDGDCLLDEKIEAADWIRTSTEASASELSRLGASAAQIQLIRRGLPHLPQRQRPRPAGGKLRILAVGRLVEKKGYPDFLRLCEALRTQGQPFEAKIIGEGPLRQDIEFHIRDRQLAAHVELLGARQREEVEACLARADLFLFTGIISRDGDRDGLPNVIPEAMALGVPVVVRPAPGVLEAVTDDSTGRVLTGDDPVAWAETVIQLWQDQAKREVLAEHAHRWVEENFLSACNTDRLAEKILSSPAGSTKTPQA